MMPHDRARLKAWHHAIRSTRNASSTEVVVRSTPKQLDSPTTARKHS
jgi:hypothetical protein